MRAACGVQQKDIKRTTDLMLMLGFNKTTGQLTMAYSVAYY